MSKGPWKFRPREVTRILKAALAAGLAAPRLELRPDGTVVISAADQDQQPERRAGEWDNI